MGEIKFMICIILISTPTILGEVFDTLYNNTTKIS